MKQSLIFLMLAMVSLFVSCSNDSPEEQYPDNDGMIDESPKEPEYNGTISGLPEGSYYVETINGKYEVINGKFYIPEENSTGEASHLMFYFVKNSSDNVVMMARIANDATNNIQIDTESTTLALVTMHPFFAMLPVSEFNGMADIIKEVEGYSALKESVRTLISAGSDLLTTDNLNIQEGLELVFEGLQQILDNNENYEEQAEYAVSRAFSGPEGIYVDCDRLDFQASGNTLNMRIFGLAPTYDGNMTDNEGNLVDEFEIPTRSDYGFLDLFTKTINNWRYGETVSTSFPGNGEFRFHFEVDKGALFGQMISYGIEMLGGNELLKKKCGIDVGGMTEFTYDRLISYYSSLSAPGEMSVSDWIGIVYEGIHDYLKANVSLDNEQDIILVQTIAKTTNLYFKVKTIGNFGGRIMGWLNADKQIEFTLCCYENEVTNCDMMEEHRLLIEFYEATNGDNWTNNENWCSNKPISEWYGIKTDEEGHVISIKLSNNNLSGSAKFLKGFINLKEINIDDNPGISYISLENPGLQEVSLSNCITYGIINNDETMKLNVSNCSSIRGIIVSTGELMQELNISNCNFGDDVVLTGKVKNFVMTDTKAGSVDGEADTATITGCYLRQCGIQSKYLNFINSTTYSEWWANTEIKLVLINSSCAVNICLRDFPESVIIQMENTTLVKPNGCEHTHTGISATVKGATWGAFIDSLH